MDYDLDRSEKMKNDSFEKQREKVDRFKLFKRSLLTINNNFENESFMRFKTLMFLVHNM